MRKRIGRDLRNVNPQALTEIERQFKTIQQMHSVPQPCPACQKSCNAYEASGRTVEDEDGYYHDTYHCPHCKRRLDLCVPILDVRPYLWQLVEPIPGAASEQQ